jgi:DMSO/TMAO reductase YedYZ molybdopterin-dependent catalytic subunit
VDPTAPPPPEPRDERPPPESPLAPAVPADPPVHLGRRVVLGMVGLGALGVALGAPISRALGDVLGSVQEKDPTGLSGLIPGAGGWRYYSVTSSEPAIDASDARLHVSGLVASPTTLTFADLAAMPQTTLTKDFQCVTGWRVPDVTWRGVALGDVLDRAGVQPTATALRLTSADGAYTESLTLEQASEDVLVATHLDDDVVSRAHGGPIRLYVPQMYGYKSLKWLSGIEVTDSVEPGYWEERGYDVDAYVGASNGRSDPPIS